MATLHMLSARLPLTVGEPRVVMVALGVSVTRASAARTRWVVMVGIRFSDVRHVDNVVV
jgi:hypothetical protein